MSEQASFAFPLGGVTQPTVDPLRIDEELRWMSRVLTREAVPRKLVHLSGRAPGASRYGISRSRNGHETAPIYRLGSFLLDLRLMGRPQEVAIRIADYLEGLVYVLWAGVEEDIDQLSLLEQEYESAETELQLRAMGSDDPIVLSDWRAALQRERAIEKRLERALGQKLARLGRRAWA